MSEVFSSNTRRVSHSFNEMKCLETSKYLHVEEQLSRFIKSEIRLWDPHYIVLVERKATAIFRSLKESKNPEFKLEWEWEKTISSSTLDQLSPKFFKDKRVLIFDDMMMKGEHLEELLVQWNRLFGSNFNTQDLRIAVFGIHQHSSSLKHNQDLDITYPSTWYYRDLSSISYEEIRSNIVRMLESSGSLLLDTEHIELRIRVKHHLSDLIEALSRTGKTVVFNSSRSRRNITVFYSQDQVAFDCNLFPPKTDFSGIVRKCRVVQRHDNEFAIIPICYPSIIADENELKEWASKNFQTLLFGTNISAKNFSPFYSAGLVAALQVLRIAVKDLIASGFEESNIYMPVYSVKDNSEGYNLNHLKVMFPGINLKELITEINTIFVEGKEWGKSIRTKQGGANETIYTDDDVLEANAIQLLQVIQYEIQKRILEEYPWDERIPHPFGLTAKEIFGLAKKLNVENDQHISSLFDILIDKAYLVTHVERRCVDGVTFFVRTFEPDGEIINKKMRDFTIRFGLPAGYSRD